MFTGLSLLINQKSQSTSTPSGSTPPPPVIASSTSSRSIKKKATREYRERRRLRVEELTTLQNDIIDDPLKWELLQMALREQQALGRCHGGITNASVRASLFGAMDDVKRCEQMMEDTSESSSSTLSVLSMYYSSKMSSSMWDEGFSDHSNSASTECEDPLVE
jgi:hypothetical protein